MNVQDVLNRLLGAAIVMIAAYVLAFPAQAHEGHGGSPAAIDAALASMMRGHATTSPSAHAVPSAVLYAGERAAPGPASPCQRDCCNPDMMCCISALVNDPALAAPLACFRRRGPLLAAIMPPGRVPAALPKPPRTFA